MEDSEIKRRMNEIEEMSAIHRKRVRSKIAKMPKKLSSMGAREEKEWVRNRVEQEKDRRKRLSQTLHSYFLKVLKQRCEEGGVRVVEAGWPDCLLVVDGRLVMVEIKTGKDKLSPSQETIRDLFTEKGVAHFVYRGQKEFIDNVKKLVS